MKHYLVVLAMLITPAMANSQGFIDEIVKSYVGKEGITSVVISPEIFKLVTAFDRDDEELQNLSNKLTSLKILVSNDKKIGFTSDVLSKIKIENYLNIMEIIDGNQKVNFYAKQKGEVIHDFILLSIDDDEEVLISISGNFKRSELSTLGSKINSSGDMSHISLLKKLEEK